MYPAAERARLFLWICMHYLEPYKEECPWDSDEPPLSRRRAPKLTKATDPTVIAAENADPPEEVSWGATMTKARQNFLERDRARQDALGAVDEEMSHLVGTEGEKPPIKPREGETPIRGEWTRHATTKEHGRNIVPKGRPTKQQSRAALGHKAPPRGAHGHAPYPESEAVARKSSSRLISEPYANSTNFVHASTPPVYSSGRRGAAHGRKSRQVHKLYEYRTPSPERTLLERKPSHLISLIRQTQFSHQIQRHCT